MAKTHVNFGQIEAAAAELARAFDALERAQTLPERRLARDLDRLLERMLAGDPRLDPIVERGVQAATAKPPPEVERMLQRIRALKV